MLEALFQQINEQHFDGFLEAPELLWNSRLRSSAGRFIPGRRSWQAVLRGETSRAVIEVATYLKEIDQADHHIRDTLAHEMIHYWLWTRRRPYGHTDEFWMKMQAMGVSRYNPVPKLRPVKYQYRCPGCQKVFPARRKLGKLACADCCKRHSGGKYDSRFLLAMDPSHVP